MAQDSAPEFERFVDTIQSQGFASLVVGVNVPGYQAEAMGEVGAASAQEAAIAEAQQALLGRLASYAVSDVTTYQYIPYLALTVTSTEALEAIFADPLVASVEEDVLFTPALTQSVPLVRAPQAHELSFDGSGQAVAVIDTGVDKNHPALLGKVVSEACFSGAGAGASICPGGLQSSTAINSGLHCSVSISGCDHGTHVAGIVAAVAPDAGIIAIQAASRFDDSNVLRPCSDVNQTSPCVRMALSDVLSGLNRVLSLRTSFNIAAVNMSLGSGRFTSFCDNNAPSIKTAIDALRAGGTNVVIAAGNSGSRDSIASPACISTAISVGATDRVDNVASISDIANIVTLMAPGSFIRSAVPGGSSLGKTGTSFAAPHVAGAVAVLKEARPNKDLSTANAIKTALTASPVSVTDSRSGGSVTKPRLDVYSALCNPIILSCDPDDFRAIFLNQTLSGSLSPATDRDVYYFNGTAGNRLTITLDRTSGSIDPYLELKDPNGNVVALNNNSGPGTNALINGRYLAITGRYTIIARNADNVFGTGNYSLRVSQQIQNINPIPRLTYFNLRAITGMRVSRIGYWVRLYGYNFIPTTELYLNNRPRSRYYVNSNLVYIFVYASDIGSPYPRTLTVRARNPEPGGGPSNPISFFLLFPLLGESELVAPPPDSTLTTGISTTFVVSWTAPLTKTVAPTGTQGVTATVPVTTWRSMQNMDLRLRDQEGNVAAWVRVVERPGATSVYRLLNGANQTAASTGTALPDEGLPGEDGTLVISDTVTLHLKESGFTGSGLTAVMTPVLTFGPNAVGTYNVEFRVDDEYGQVQDEDVLGQITIAPPGCLAMTGAALSGPDTATTGADVNFSVAIEPVSATGPITYTWSPEPKSGQGTANAVYNFASAGEPFVFVSLENCGGFSADLKAVRVSTSPEPALGITKSGPATALAGQPITYTLTINNSGAQTATNLVVIDVLPDGAAHVGDGTLAGLPFSQSLPELGGFGQSAQVSFAVIATASITNSAYFVTADGNLRADGADAVVTRIVDGQSVLSPLEPGSLTFAKAGEAPTTVQLPAGTVAEETVLVAVELPGPPVALPDGQRFAGRAFQLDAYQNNQLVPDLVLGESISITVGYSEADLGGGDQNQLALYYQDGNGWTNVGLACTLQAGANQLSCRFDDAKLTTFMLAVPVEEEAFSLYLPSVQLR